MHRRPHDKCDEIKVWLSASEVDQLLEHVEDTTHWIAVALGLRCGLRTAELVAVTPADVVDGPAGTMLRIHETAAKGGQYRETPVPTGLTTTIRTVDDIRQAPSDAPLVDVSTRTVRRWVDRYAAEFVETTGDDGWYDLTAHDFRRTWATLLAGTEGVDPLLVCDWGGWSDLETFLKHYRGAYSPEVQRRARHTSTGSDPPLPPTYDSLTRISAEPPDGRRVARSIIVLSYSGFGHPDVLGRIAALGRGTWSYTLLAESTTSGEGGTKPEYEGQFGSCSCGLPAAPRSG